MKKTFIILLGLIVAFSSFTASYSQDNNDYNEDGKDENPVVYNVSISSNGNGSAYFEGYAETSIQVTDGTSITVVVTPDEGYKFVGYYVGESTTPVNLGLTLDVSGDIALIAVFEKEEDREPVFQVVEQNPEFPGGMKELMKYLQENVCYPEISLNNNSQGRPFVRFTVNADGSITDVTILKSSGDIYLDIEAIRVVSNMPNWSPGKQAGKPVRVSFTLPVVFRLP